MGNHIHRGFDSVQILKLVQNSRLTLPGCVTELGNTRPICLNPALLAFEPPSVHAKICMQTVSQYSDIYSKGSERYFVHFGRRSEPFPHKESNLPRALKAIMALREPGLLPASSEATEVPLAVFHKSEIAPCSLIWARMMRIMVGRSTDFRLERWWAEGDETA